MFMDAKLLQSAVESLVKKTPEEIALVSSIIPVEQMKSMKSFEEGVSNMKLVEATISTLVARAASLDITMSDFPFEPMEEALIALLRGIASDDDLKAIPPSALHGFQLILYSYLTTLRNVRQFSQEMKLLGSDMIKARKDDTYKPYADIIKERVKGTKQKTNRYNIAGTKAPEGVPDMLTIKDIEPDEEHGVKFIAFSFEECDNRWMLKMTNQDRFQYQLAKLAEHIGLAKGEPGEIIMITNSNVRGKKVSREFLDNLNRI